MTEQQILVNGLNINYKKIGSGKPFLVLHGWNSSSDKWQRVAELVSERNIQLIIPDLPGFGKSQSLPDSWSIDNYVEWVLQFCEKVPELQKEFYLMGHSFGGAISAKFAIKYNQRVEKLFLVSAACVRKNTTSKKIFYRISKVVKIFSFLPGYNLFRKAVYKFIIRRSDYNYQSGVMKETYLRVLMDDLSHKLGFVKVPTVIIFGDKDESTPLEEGKLINEKIRSSKLVVIPGTDHLLHIKVPEILSNKILENI